MIKRKLLIGCILCLCLSFLIGCSNTQNNGRIKMKNGSFYFVSDLYKNKKIKDNDILNIAYRNNNGYLYNEDGEELSFLPEVIVPVEEINQELLETIISDYFDMLMEDDYFKNSELEISDIKLSVYCGVYNGYYALRFQDNKVLAAVSGEENIGGLRFIYPYKGGNTVILWKQN